MLLYKKLWLRMPLSTKSDALFWSYKNVADDPILKQRWVSAQLLEKGIKHKYEDFEFSSRMLTRAIGNRVHNCDILIVPNGDHIYKCVHNFTKQKMQKRVSFFYFAGNNSVELPPPPTANNSPKEWAALLNEQTELEELFMRTDFTQQLADQEDELLCVRSFLQPKLSAPVVCTVTVSPAQVATVTVNDYGSPARERTASYSVPPSFSTTTNNNLQVSPHKLLDSLVTSDYGSPARAVTASSDAMPASPSGVKSIDFFQDRIATKIKKLGIDNAKKDEKFKQAVYILRHMYASFSSIKIDSVSQQYFSLCTEVDQAHRSSCETFKITERNMSGGVFCESCSMKRKLESNRQGKRAKYSYTKPSANRRLISLDNEQLIIRLE